MNKFLCLSFVLSMSTLSFAQAQDVPCVGNVYVKVGSGCYIKGMEPGTEGYARSRCEALVPQIALRQHQIHRGAHGFVTAPGSMGNVFSDEYYCITTCNEFIREFLSTGTAKLPIVQCHSRLAHR